MFVLGKHGVLPHKTIKATVMESNSTRLTLSETKGPLAQIMDVLAGKDGKFWLKALNKTLRRENPWGGTANFLNEDCREYDWRYVTCAKVGLHQKATTYWIGIVSLDDVSEEKNQYRLQYYHGNRFPTAEEVNRDRDGFALGGATQYSFNLSEMKTQMLEAKEKKYSFFNLFIEEIVYENGMHVVNALYREIEGKSPEYGLNSKVRWPNMPIKDLIHLSTVQLDESIKRVRILSHEPYNWLN
jgi:hypothetical protein